MSNHHDLLELAETSFPPAGKVFWQLVSAELRSHHLTKTQSSFLPAAAWARLLGFMQYLGNGLPNDSWVGMSMVFLPWLYSQRIYVMDAELASELTQKEYTHINNQVLSKLPDWAIHIQIDLPEDVYVSPSFWVALTDPAEHEREYFGDAKVLRLVAVHTWDDEAPIRYVTLKCDMDQTIGDMLNHYYHAPDRVVENAISREFMDTYMPTLLFLCSDSPDIPQPNEPNQIHFKRSLRKRKATTDALRPKKPRRYNVGAEFGKQIRKHRAQLHTMSLGSMKPHIRAAHWHTFLAGPRDKPRERRVKWVNAILVNFKEAELIDP